MKKLLVGFSVLALALSAQNVKEATFSIEKAQDNQLHVMLQSDADVYGLQFDVNYDPSQITLSESEINHMFNSSDSRSNVSIYSKVKEPGLARVIMFDLGGQAILNANSLEKVVSLTYTSNDDNAKAKVMVNNIVAAGRHGEEVPVVNNDYTYDFDTAMDIVQPFETEIVGNFPNPFNPTTKIEFNLKTAGHVDVVVYDLQGRKVAELYSGLLEAKQGHVFNWDGSSVASGQYFARITAPGFSDVLNMTLIK